MSAVVLFEQSQRGEVWRLEVTEYQGRTFANFRKWFPSGDTFKPTREGVTFSIDRLADLAGAAGDYLAAQNGDGA